MAESKHCWACGQDKPLSEFNRDASRKDGFGHQCRECGRERARRRRAVNRATVIICAECQTAFERPSIYGYAPIYCGPCGKERRRKARNARQRQYNEANREAVLARKRQWHVANRESVNTGRHRRYVANLPTEREYQRQYREQLRSSVFAHYGTSCACCGASDGLTIDHVAGGGGDHRASLFGHQVGGAKFYYWLIRQGFPSGYQTLCVRCNQSKGTGERCRLPH